MQSSEKNNFNLSPIKVGFILPAFNEYENIFELLKQIELIFNNKLIKIICGHQLSVNRKVSPNIMVTQVNGNFKYPFGL